MNETDRGNVINNMLKLYEGLNENLSDKKQEIVDIQYYKDFQFGNTNLGKNNVYIVKIKDDSIPEKEIDSRNDKEQENYIYEIYDKENNLIATVDMEGKLQFRQEFIQKIDKRYLPLLNLENEEFKLPEELTKDDLVLTKEEIHRSGLEKEITKNKNVQQDEKLDNLKDKTNDIENMQNRVSHAKGIPANNVLILRPDSNFYKDHPEVEQDLYFYKGEDGVIRAEYLDKDGNPQPSNFFEPSSTAIRQETISMGNDGKPVEKETPYQVMQTKNLVNRDKDVRDIRMNITIDTYGYMEISEARQGTNGMWSSHDIEVKGRDYNSYGLNQMTSIETRKADPDKSTDAYKKLEQTEYIEDGADLSEMFLIQHASEIIQKFIDEGYNKSEAVQIFNLMIGEEKLTEEQAKKEVNNNIKENDKYKSDKDLAEEDEFERSLY